MQIALRRDRQNVQLCPHGGVLRLPVVVAEKRINFDSLPSYRKLDATVGDELINVWPNRLQRCIHWNCTSGKLNSDLTQDRHKGNRSPRGLWDLDAMR